VREILRAIEGRTMENDQRWAGYERTPAEHLLIAAEELGEVAEAMQSDSVGGYRWPPEFSDQVYEELCDLGAVVVAMMRRCRP